MDDAVFLEKLRRYYALWREDNEIYGEWAQARGFSYFELIDVYKRQGRRSRPG